MAGKGGYIRSYSRWNSTLYWEPWLTSVDIPAQLTIRSQLETAKWQKAIHQVCMGMWHLVIPSFGLSVMTDSPPPQPLFCHSKNPMIPPKSSAPTRAINNDRSLMYNMTEAIMNLESGWYHLWIASEVPVDN